MQANTGHSSVCMFVHFYGLAHERPNIMTHWLDCMSEAAICCETNRVGN